MTHWNQMELARLIPAAVYVRGLPDFIYYYLRCSKVEGKMSIPVWFDLYEGLGYTLNYIKNELKRFRCLYWRWYISFFLRFAHYRRENFIVLEFWAIRAIGAFRGLLYFAITGHSKDTILELFLLEWVNIKIKLLKSKFLYLNSPGHVLIGYEYFLVSLRVFIILVQYLWDAIRCKSFYS